MGETIYRLPRLDRNNQTIAGLLTELGKITIPVNSGRKNSGVGRTQVFGKISRRNLGFGEASNNKKFPRLYELLRELGDEIVPFKYDAIQLNHNYESLPHRDKNNCGLSLIVSFGKYRGGRLFIDGRPYSTKMHPIVFDGSALEHYNDEIHGDKYSVVYFRARKSGRVCF